MSSTFDGLGRALRWLRDERGKRQFQVADAAGITKPMLSAYETGRQKPSLESLEKILDALGADLSDLHAALAIVNGRETARPRRGWEPYPLPLGAAAGEPAGGGADLYRAVGVQGPLPRWQEEAMTEMLQGFHTLLRHLLGALSRLEERAGGGRGEGEGGESGERGGTPEATETAGR